jgi:hypothetical protein
MVVYFGGAQIFQKTRKYLQIRGAQSMTFQDKALWKIVLSEEIWLFLQNTTA